MVVWHNVGPDLEARTDVVHGVRLVRPLPEIQPRPVWLVMPPELRGLPRLRAAANAIAAELRRRLA
jgi:DNA-binding transcriptional LysR family regulator